MIGQPLGNLNSRVSSAIDQKITTGVDQNGFGGKSRSVGKQNGVRFGNRQNAQENQRKEEPHLDSCLRAGGKIGSQHRANRFTRIHKDMVHPDVAKFNAIAVDHLSQCIQVLLAESPWFGGQLVVGFETGEAS